MKNLKSWQKLAVLGAVFTIPFVAVIYRMAASINALGLASSKLELQGLAYYPAALTLVKDLQLHRGLVNGPTRGNASSTDALAAKRP
jgi:hypothetical protein